MKQNILVIGSGGREHAIIYTLKKSKRCGKIYCAPGNAGIRKLARCVKIGAMQFDEIVKFAKEKAVGLVFVAPDDPLAAGQIGRAHV